MALIDLEDVWKCFRVRRDIVEAVRGLHLQVAEGEMFGFLGPNGAGKSTTVRILATLLKPDQGRASVAGFDLANQAAQVRIRIGYVGQSRGIGDGATGRAHLLFQAHAYGSSGASARQRAQELIKQFTMEAFVDRPIRTYSGGQYRRLHLALGIVHRPKILFLDEPSLGLVPRAGPISGMKCADCIRWERLCS
ncbi:hypothetical protein KDW_46500 [Dictyobacter vulcani]|uniref:ABC transporter domain-containing protein n=1 Tax=Dictyobacter vulcani TaxID=2607529 RepID=A0A5J4KL98_9CHLR|nr:ATP-binding cassette domain-containing protein [Dictyobacter vulcani]GER90488.1 hypothetical protein KDW_46500 [Dictyobacter vulcani]